jgi:hypothetical protein
MENFRQDNSAPEDQRDYYQQRAKAETELARRATHPAVVASHYRMAEAYLALVEGNAPVQDEPGGAAASA